MNKGILAAVFKGQGGRIALLVLWCACAAPAADDVFARESIINSPHNLSASGGKGKHAVSFEEVRICVFCHAPHNAKPKLPLWNRDLSEADYTPYESTTLQASPKPDRPTGASRLCLSCHDGTIALNSYGGRVLTGTGGGSGYGWYTQPDEPPTANPTYMPTDPVPTKNPNLQTDLSNDHPISFSYTSGLAAIAQLVPPESLPSQVRLELGEILQCNACHDPHNNEFGNFLVIDNKRPGSPLCMACHNNTGWSESSHYPLQTGTDTFGCMNCHYAHNAPAPARLLHSTTEMDNCITTTCHNNGTSPSSANVQPLFAQAYRHPVAFYTGDHDENEVLPAQKTHVECVDCHNPHQANRADVPLSFPPAVNGPLKGVRGIDKDTLGVKVATAEYEICFKCHSGGNAGNFLGITNTPPNRMIAEPDQRKRLDSYNTTSYHPVTAQRRGTGVSLLGSYQTDMQKIYCCDCHNSDQSTRAGGGGPNGPHASFYEHILISRYDMPLPSPQAPSYPQVLDFTSRYALCFRCHNDSYVMGSSSGFYDSATGSAGHTKHVQDRGIPCFACHDPHGVPGTSSPVSSHLVNMSKDYAYNVVTLANPTYTPAATGGSCTAVCHSSADKSRSYTR